MRSWSVRAPRGRRPPPARATLPPLHPRGDVRAVHHVRRRAVSPRAQPALSIGCRNPRFGAAAPSSRSMPGAASPAEKAGARDLRLQILPAPHHLTLMFPLVRVACRAPETCDEHRVTSQGPACVCFRDSAFRGAPPWDPLCRVTVAQQAGVQPA